MILFHTAFKFGGIVSVSFEHGGCGSARSGWPLFYLHPDSAVYRGPGAESSLNEVKAMKGNLTEVLRDQYKLEESSYHNYQPLPWERIASA
ncbi:MAG: hypothetical protein R2778_07675 [Saprospiraceae bacterium]